MRATSLLVSMCEVCVYICVCVCVCVCMYMCVCVCGGGGGGGDYYRARGEGLKRVEGRLFSIERECVCVGDGDDVCMGIQV